MGKPTIGKIYAFYHYNEGERVIAKLCKIDKDDKYGHPYVTEDGSHFKNFERLNVDDIDSFGWIIHDVLCRDGKLQALSREEHESTLKRGR